MDEQRIARRILTEIVQLADRPVRLMEVCGTHTVAIFRSGIRSILPPEVELLSGPGCPVCVTPTQEIDRAIELARKQEVILATFGDLMRVPGSTGSLVQVRGEGARIQVVLSPLDAVKIAIQETDKKVVFFGVGFETTSPAIAVAVKEAYRRDVKNFFLISAQRLIPPALRALLANGRTRIDGFILPGHVSVIIGSYPYDFIAKEFGISGIITGFESLDILQGIYFLLKQIKIGQARIGIQYTRAVRPEGNSHAREIMEEVFRTVPSNWRGLGVIPDSGLALREEFARFDARLLLNGLVEEVPPPPGCQCGEILQGIKRPVECPLYGGKCTPDHPVGPCMVSSEGTCAAYFKYGGGRGWGG